MDLMRKLRYKYAKLTRRIDKKWPINVRVHQVKGNQTVVYEDRARTVIQEDGKKNLDIYKEGTTLSVPYKYFTNRKDGGEEIELLKAGRDNFIPIPTDIDFTDVDLDELEEQEDENGEQSVIEMDEAVDRIVDIDEWRLYAENLYDENANTVETDEREHFLREYQKEIGVFILLIGGGIYFFLLTKGAKKYCEFAGGAAETVLPLLMFKAKDVKQKVKGNF